MSLVSRLTCSGRMVTQGLILRPLPRPFLQSVKHMAKKAFPDHEHPAKAHVLPEEINPADPHTNTGSGDIHVGPGVGKPPPRPKTVEDFANPNPDIWMTYGFDMLDKKRDRQEAHLTFFIIVTCMMYGAAAVVYYFPDMKLDNWVTREAYMEIERRKKAGGPYVSRDYVPPELIHLPSDEEIGEMDIII